jgi:hypothetical protein
MLSARLARAGLRASTYQISSVSRSAAIGGIRTYAAAASQDVRPPVALYGIDGTYANALVRMADNRDGFRLSWTRFRTRMEKPLSQAQSG